MPSSRKIGILPFKANDNDGMSGSAFLRAHGLANNSNDYEIWKHAVKYDGLIFQKNYWKEMMELYQGPKILDLCDADWIKSSADFFKFCNLADAISCSSPELMKFISDVLPAKPVYYVPDRLDFSLFPKSEKIHSNRAKTIVWFGYIKNAYITLKPMLPVIKALKLRLKIISDKDYERKEDLTGITYKVIKYNQLSAYEEISESDIVLNPKSPKGAFKYKSNNKTIVGWKLGIPVAETNADIERFLDADARNEEMIEKKIFVNSKYNITQSVIDYDNIFDALLNK